MKILIPLLFVLVACKAPSVEKINPIDKYMNIQTLSAMEARDEYLQLLSQVRSQKGLPDLIVSEFMNEVAQGHTDKMASGELPFSHDGSSERCHTISSELLSGKVCTEIIAKGLNSAEKVLQYWAASKTHLGHLLNPYSTHTGVGVAKDSNGSLYWTQIFIEVN